MVRVRVVPFAVVALVACSSSASAPTGTPRDVVSTPTVTAAASAAGSPTGGAASTTPITVSIGTEISVGTALPAADACSLLTPEDIVAATGVAFGNPRAETPQQTQYGSYTACTWIARDSPLTTVRVTVWDGERAYDDAKTQLGDAQDLGEVGDRAFTSSLAAVYAVANGHTLFVQYSDFDSTDENNLPISIGLAEVAVTNL
jgi:hypothetical protein